MFNNTLLLFFNKSAYRQIVLKHESNQQLHLNIQLLLVEPLTPAE